MVYVLPKTSFATPILELAFQEDHLVFWLAGEFLMLSPQFHIQKYYDRQLASAFDACPAQ